MIVRLRETSQNMDILFNAVVASWLLHPLDTKCVVAGVFFLLFLMQTSFESLKIIMERQFLQA